MERILGDADRLQAVAEDFIAHYENRVAEGSTVEEGHVCLRESDDCI